MNFPLAKKRVFIRGVAALLTATFACSAVILVRDLCIAPRTQSVYPRDGEVGVEPNTPITLTFNKGIAPRTISPMTFTLYDQQGSAIPGTITYDDATQTAILLPMSALNQNSTYAVRLKGGSQGILDRYRHPLRYEERWAFTTGIRAAKSPAQGSGGPILVITSKANAFTQYYAEILRNEGLNEFDVEDIERVTDSELAEHDVVLIGEMAIDDGHARKLIDWVKSGGTLVAMRPPKNLAGGLGLSAPIGEGNDPIQRGGYLRINGGNPASGKLIRQPIQFHGDADRYTGDRATIIASLCNDGKIATQNPAVSSTPMGRGNAIVFSYDLAKSVVYTHQGNPEWSGVERDGIPPVRSDDLFFGGSAIDPEPDWVDPEKIAIPQADIQQRLLANLIINSNLDKKPLPRFWYLPRGLKAVIVMTGDDHGHGGTVGRFQSYQRKSISGCSLENWECIRATSNIFVGSISSSDAAYFTKQGFEIGLHVYTACTDWPTRVVMDSSGVGRRQVIFESADAIYSQQLKGFAAKYPDVPPPVSNRTDCITWGDFDTQPQVELNHGIRLDTNYYYWPAKWVKDKPGLFTGSGLPMRFARQDGSPIDVYQAPTQMTDESSQSYPFTVDTLLANAVGDLEYFGVFVANMHNDQVKSSGSDAILSSAQKYHVPVITAAQLLKWLDGRNASAFRGLNWSDNTLSFSIDVGVGGNGIEAMLPLHSGAGSLTSVSLKGTALRWQTRTVAGLSYAVIRAEPGIFSAYYGRPTEHEATAH
jgi:hypothetical protein